MAKQMVEGRADSSPVKPTGNDEHCSNSKPNLMRVARTLAACNNPDRVLVALDAMLSAHAQKTDTTVTADNNQLFCETLNGLQNPCAVYNALMVFAGHKEAVRL